jgi:hypothetical protein
MANAKRRKESPGNASAVRGASKNQDRPAVIKKLKR